MAENNHTHPLDKQPHTFEFIGGTLCLDFVNTIDGRGPAGSHQDYLSHYEDLLLWAAQAGLLDDLQVERLRQRAEDHSIEATTVLDEARLLREAIYHIFSAIHLGQQPAQADLNLLSHVLSEAMAHARLRYVEGDFLWDWPDDDERLQQMLWPVARSAAELLTKTQIERVHLCANDSCGWLFLDTSKNHSRRWCSMETCGNVTKVRKHRKRQRSAKRNDAD